MEALVPERIPQDPPVYNVATGRSVAIRQLVEELCRLAGIEMVTALDPTKVRPNDPPEICGDVSALRQLTGWVPEIPLTTTLRDLLQSLSASSQM